MVRRAEDLTGETFGDYTIIGDTGKRGEKGGRQIVIARHNETGEILEGEASNFKRNKMTGYIGSLEHRERMSELSRGWTNEERYIKDIKSKISQYKNTKGYRFRRDINKYQARISIDGKEKSLGSFNTEAEAKAARKKAVDEQIKILKNQLEKDDL